MQKDMMRDSEATIQKTMKRWEDECDALHKLNNELQKSLSDLRKSERKFNDADQTQKETLKFQVGNLEVNFCIQKVSYQTAPCSWKCKIFFLPSGCN